MNTFMEETTTRCVGRYLIDMPASFSVKSDNVLAFINKAPVTTKRLYRPAFEQKIRRREMELKRTKTVNPLDMPFLKAVHALPAGMEGVIFERNVNNSEPDVGRILEAHLYTNGVAVEIELNADNGSAERYTERRNEYPELYQNTIQDKMAELTALLKRISGKTETGIPYQAGFCLPDIFIADGSFRNKESINVIYTSQKYKAIKLNLDTDSFTKSDSALLSRVLEMNKAIKASAGKTLRKGRREINRIYTEEWLVAGKVDENDEVLRFILQANETTPGENNPKMYISFLQRSLSEDNALSENEAVSVWEQITGTLRLRPGAFGW
ncbi:T6SS immunity protein Tli4 family protein [Mangrovibacter yixingensis]|uniref:T6SS immunity protein Tli4 family protein n=1 Tax=Mangrovibacter yixingensis TaxID=1529639 RepID=UPI001CFCEF24|nr:T6SS immunity protein Tli4 family protein [Mangrovibacter yixingensis]